MKENYHTHHYLCKHAQGNASDYVKEAMKKGLTVLGFSDHAPSNDIKDIYVRMDMEELDIYLNDVNDAKKTFKDKITILTGLEVEYFPDNEEYFEFLKSKTDYLIHGQHYISFKMNYENLQSGFGLHTKEQIYKYADFLEEAIKSGHFQMFAHPDLYMTGYRDWDEHAEKVAHRICRIAKEYDAVLEFNANGFRRRLQKTKDGLKRPYPRDEFWEIAKSYKVKTFINSDCHSPELLRDTYWREAEEVYQKLGLKNAKINIKK